MAPSIPEDARSFAATKLGELPHGTRLVLAWDPDQWLSDDEFVDSTGRRWQVLPYDGDDLRLAARWRVQGGASVPTIVRLSPPPHDRNRTLDISYLDWLIPQVEQFIDLSIAAILTSFAPGEAWQAGIAHQFAAMLGRDLKQAALAYKKIREKVGKAIPLAEHHVRAMALAAAVKGLTPTDVLFDVTDPVIWLRQYLKAAVVADGHGYSDLVRQQAYVTLPAPSLQAWVEAPIADVSRLLYAVLALRAFQADPDPITIRGLALIGNPDPLLEAVSIAEQTLDDPDLRVAIVKAAEATLSDEDLRRIVSVRERIPGEDLAGVVSTAPRMVAWTILKRELLAAAALAEPLSFVIAWRQPSSEIALGQPLAAAVQALNLLKSVLERLGGHPLRDVRDAEALIRWYVDYGSTLEYDVAAARNAFRETKDRELREKWDGVIDVLRNRVRGLLHQADAILAKLIGDIPQFLQRKDLVINVIRDLILRPGKVPPRTPAVWLIVFDGMRWDTWERVVRPLIEQEFEIRQVRPYLSILPSKTDISRTSLVAGQLPLYWRNLEGKWTKNEEQLGARLFNLKPADVRADYQFRTRADEDVRRDSEKNRQRRGSKYNVLIYNVSDDWLHDYRKDVYQLNREVERYLREVILPDILTFVGNGDLVVVSSDHGFVELDRGDGVVIDIPMSFGAESQRRITEANISYRYLKDIPDPDTEAPSVSWANMGRFTLAVGHRWFQRPGQGATFARYSHGGISLEEMVVPGALLTRAAAPVTKLEWREWPSPVSIKEDESWDGTIVIANTGTRTATFHLEVRPSDATLEPATGPLAPGTTCSIKVHVPGYAEAGLRRLDVTGSYWHEGGEVLRLPPLSISVKVAERVEKVVFSDALDLLDET